MSIQDLRAIAPGLSLDPRGIWRADTRERVSYPDDGNAVCADLEDDSFWFAHRDQAIRAALSRFPPGGTLFDVGGGNGSSAGALSSAGYEIVVVEPGLMGAMNARARGIETVICATLRDAGFAAGSLPAVGLFDVVEHIEDDAGFLAEVERALTPGGRVYITVPAHQWLWSIHDKHAGHFRRYTSTSLGALLASSGFEIELATPFFAPLVLPILLLRALPYRLGLSSSTAPGSYQRTHAPRGPQAGFLGWLLRRERAALLAQRRLPFGASLLAVARKR